MSKRDREKQKAKPAISKRNKEENVRTVWQANCAACNEDIEVNTIRVILESGERMHKHCADEMKRKMAKERETRIEKGRKRQSKK